MFSPDEASNTEIINQCLNKENNCFKCTVQLKHFPSCDSETDVFISVFIMCGSPEDIISLKSKVKGKIPEEIVFILIDVYK